MGLSLQCIHASLFLVLIYCGFLFVCFCCCFFGPSLKVKYISQSFVCLLARFPKVKYISQSFVCLLARFWLLLFCNVKLLTKYVGYLSSLLQLVNNNYL